MTNEELCKANALKSQLDNIDSFLKLNKSDKSNVTVEVEGSEGSMGANFRKSISFKWGSELGIKIQAEIKDYQYNIKKDLKTYDSIISNHISRFADFRILSSKENSHRITG